MPTLSSKPALVQRLVLGLLLALLGLPALQAKWPLVPVASLGGYAKDVPTPHFSWQGLGQSTFQPQLEAYLNQRLGFRPWLVRLRNQAAYSAWQELLTPGLVLGKDQNIYQQGPADAYLGRDFIGEAEIAKRARRLRLVQDSLQAHGTQLLFLIAPGKTRLQPQYLVDSSATQPKGPTNYDVVRAQFAKQGVHTLDAAALLLRWRDAGAAYPLFPRTGTHWSAYAVAHVADTLFRRLESLTGHDLPDFGQRGVPTVVARAADLRFTDNDLGELANLLRPIPPYPMAYPQVAFAPAGAKPRLNMLVIGDSFAQSFYGFYPYYQQLLTPSSRYWNYNTYVYWPETTPGESRAVADLDLRQQLRGRQAVLLVANEENLNKLGYGFIDQAFKLFHPFTAQEEAHIQRIIQGMRDDPKWLARIAARASEQGIQLDQALRQDALYLQDQER